MVLFTCWTQSLKWAAYTKLQDLTDHSAFRCQLKTFLFECSFFTPWWFCRWSPGCKRWTLDSVHCASCKPRGSDMDVMRHWTIPCRRRKLLLEWLRVSCSEEARLRCTSEGLVAPLVYIMSSGNNEEVIQACRALGNMCFDNGLFNEQLLRYCFFHIWPIWLRFLVTDGP